jgi:hypothetical protein
MVAQAESVTEATGSSIAPYGSVALAAFRGQEAPATHLIQTATEDAERRGEGRALSYIGDISSRSQLAPALPARAGAAPLVAPER